MVFLVKIILLLQNHKNGKSISKTQVMAAPYLKIFPGITLPFRMQKFTRSLFPTNAENKLEKLLVIILKLIWMLRTRRNLNKVNFRK